MIQNTLSRIKQFIDFKSISVSFFEKETGMSNGSFASQLKNNKTIGVDKLENILNKYPEINPDWLLTGNGTMLREKTQQQPVATPCNCNCNTELEHIKKKLQQCQEDYRHIEQVKQDYKQDYDHIKHKLEICESEKKLFKNT